MTPTAKRELHRYVQSRKPKFWTPVNIGDAAVALACAVGFVWLIL